MTPGQPQLGAMLQSRDYAIFRSLFESRVMTTRHLADIHFNGHLAYAYKRLRRLKAAGHLIERPRRSTDPAVFCLGKMGYETLLDAGELGETYPRLTWPQLDRCVRNVSERTLNHELKVMDVRCSFERSIASNPRLSIMQFSTWPRLFEFTIDLDEHEIPVQGDAFIRLLDEERNEEMKYFVEVDLSTEIHDVLLSKMLCYRRFYQSGGLAERFGFPAGQPHAAPMIVLLIVKNDERRNNAAEKLLQLDEPILRQVWLSTLPEVLNDPLAAIWIRPKDYRATVVNTPFDSTDHRSVYVTRPEREQHVAQSIAKHRLLDDIS